MGEEVAKGSEGEGEEEEEAGEEEETDEAAKKASAQRSANEQERNAYALQVLERVERRLSGFVQPKAPSREGGAEETSMGTSEHVSWMIAQVMVGSHRL